jgi:hypothetical protein
MRRLAAVLALVLVTLSCGGGNGAPSPSATAATTSPNTSATATASPTPSTSSSPSASPSPTVQPTLRLPADAPTELSDPAGVAQVVAGDVTPLVPPGSTVMSTSFTGGESASPLEQVAFTWRRGEDPFAAEQGFVVWQRFETDPPWRAVYAFTDAPSEGVLAVDLETMDITRDQIPDFLTLERSGGSGDCGTWRVIVPAAGGTSEVFRRTGCDMQIDIVGDHLEMHEAVYRPRDPHCCPSAYRITTFEWDGQAFVETSSEVTPTS